MELIELNEIREAMGGDPEEFNRFVHFSWCIKEAGNSGGITPIDIDELYGSFISGQIGGVSIGSLEGFTDLNEEEKFTKDGYQKFFFSIVEYERHVNPYEEWRISHPEGNDWILYVQEAHTISEDYEKDPEKWIAELRVKLIDKIFEKIGEGDE